MFYIINHTINFRSTDGLIWLEHDDASSIALTVTTSRLLAFLLERQGEVVTREEILSQVWDAHGLRSSNNSLNKYISDLRSIFRNMGCSEEVIITVPRIGFMLSGECVVKKDALTPQAPDNPPRPVESRAQRKPGAFFIILALSLIMLALVSGLKEGLALKKKNSELHSQKTWSVGQINGCQVSSLIPASPETARQKLDIVKDIFDTEKLTCTSDSEIYVQVAESVYYGSPGRVFLAICRKTDHSGAQFTSCYNYYENAYEIKKNPSN